MSRKAQSTRLDSWEWDKQHREKLAAKMQKIEGLRALLQMWEENPEHDHEYILKLRAKLRSAENQLAAMSI